MKVRMINSVGEHAAGTEIDLPEDLADRFIILGYAAGVLSRKYTMDEMVEMRAGNQEVSVLG